MELKTILNGKFIRGDIKRRYYRPFLKDSEKIYVNSLVKMSGLSIPRNINNSLENSEEIINNFLKLFKRNRLKYSKLLALECSIPLFESKKKMDNAISFLSQCVPRYKKELNLKNKENIFLFSKGTILISLSGSDPLEGLINAFIPALFIGNTIFVKPSKKSPLIVYNIFRDYIASFKFSSFINLLIPERKLLERLISNRSFDFVYWTGSYSSAKEIYLYCAKSFTEFYFEGSGADKLFIFKGFRKWKLFHETIMRSLIDLNGNNCNRVHTIFVDKEISSEVVKRIIKLVKRISFAENMDSSKRYVIGPRNDPNEIGELGKIKERVIFQEAYKHLKDSGLFYGPEIIFQSESDQIFDNEIFGPIILLREVSDPYDQLIQQPENSYGLGITLFYDEKDVRFEKSFLNSLPFGRINLNKNPLTVSLFDPWGGTKKSGFGGANSWLDKFSNKKYVND
jgi:acyl-CoA reductase-like NAD-dependent aldehyde dehydrogenase